MEVFQVAGRVIIQNHQIDDQSLQSPIGMREEEVTDEGKFFLFGDAQEHNRLIAGNAVSPQGRLAQPIGCTSTLEGAPRGSEFGARSPCHPPESVRKLSCSRVARRHVLRGKQHSW